MRKDRKDQRKTPILKRITKKWAGILSVTVLALSISGAVWYGIARANEEDTSNSESSSKIRSLQNGGFENFTPDGDKNQILYDNVPFWNTTAVDKKIEFVKENTDSYIRNVTVKPSEGKWAAELNADEESTLYQNVKTTPSSIYEWGLDHGARSSKDTMALVIGPKQKVNPSKPSKGGRDQLMQMIDWFKQKVTITEAMVPKQYTIYSKEFAANGTFKDNAGNNAFSFTPSKIYTEKWQIWIMADSWATSGTNPWGHYGSNAEGSAGSTDESGTTQLNLNKYYLYKVPAGQTETMFGFVSVETRSGYTTYGNFLDNVNFQLYHPLSGSTTTHGSAIIGASDGGTDSTGAANGHKVTVNNNVATYVTDGQPLKIQAILKKDDADQGCSFVGVYQTRQNENGENETTFLKLSNIIADNPDLTEANKKGHWIVSQDPDTDDTLYTYYLDNVTSAVDLQFIFIKSPTITYDSNGGKKYKVERTYNTDEAENVYSFKPASTSDTSDTASGLTFIPPYTSKAAEGKNDGWKFMGWLLTGNEVDNVPSDVETVDKNKLGELLLPAVHTIACNYSNPGAEGSSAAQYFKVYDGTANFNKEIVEDTNDKTKVKGVKWTKTENDNKRRYANVHNGMTMVAQWRWRQAFIPQVKPNTSDSYTDSEKGGTIEISGVSENNENYTAKYNNVGKAYHAETNEKITVTATPNVGFVFEGWYDGNNNLLTTNETYSYTETAESVNTYYARFSGGITQTYIRQIKNGDKWTETKEDSIATLGRYEYIDAPGKSVSSTASAGNGYKFIGWYDEQGNEVSINMLTNSGTTLQYTTTKDATYYARFAKTYTVKFKVQTKQTNGTFADNGNGGAVTKASGEGAEGDTVNSTANANTGYKFIGWYKNEELVSKERTYAPNIKSETDGITYYARFEIDYNPTVENKVYLSFIAESEKTEIPTVFNNRNAGTGKNSSTEDYGLDSKYGNTIATGFKYSVGNATGISTIQITVEIPAGSYVKTGSNSSFNGSGESILSDSSGVTHNKGQIKKIDEMITKTYHWNVTEIKAGTQYGFIIDNLYAPGATATITVNGTEGTKVTDENGVVNTDATAYKEKSHYSKSR